MHESSLAKQILTLSLAALARTGAPDGALVVAIRGWVAETEHLSREALELHFRGHARGTVAQDARLELSLQHVRARCLGCGESYLPEHHVLLCPRCGSTEGEQLGETGLKIESLDLDTGP